MQIRHDLGLVAVRGDQLRVHVAGMACGVAQTRKTVDFRQAPQEAAEAPGRAVGSFAVIGIDVLAEQSDLPRAARDQPFRLRNDVADGPGELGAAGVGHHTETAELVAAFLYGEEGGRSLRRTLLRQMIEL